MCFVKADKFLINFEEELWRLDLMLVRGGMHEKHAMQSCI